MAYLFHSTDWTSPFRPALLHGLFISKHRLDIPLSILLTYYSPSHFIAPIRISPFLAFDTYHSHISITV